MKIVHICLACFYVEGMGYQENILPKMHKMMGHDVTILASDFTFEPSGKIQKRALGDYINKDGVKVKVIEKKSGLPFLARYRIYKGLYYELEIEKPQIIFVHGGQFHPVKDIVEYVKKNNVKLYIDQHGDYYNTPVNDIKGFIWQKIIYRHCVRKLAKYAIRVYGTTPWRCKYLKEVYGIKDEKIALLMVGGDDYKIDFEKKNEISQTIREEHGIKSDDFLIVTGGKIDQQKNIHLLMQAINEIENDNVKLIVFGCPSKDMEDSIEKLSGSSKIRMIGWLDSDDVYKYFMAADLVVFPGTHSVMWEQACACGTPCVFKHWEYMRHIDLDGNCEFLYSDSKEEIHKIIQGIVCDKNKYNEMKENARKGINEFSYRKIAKEAIGIR